MKNIFVLPTDKLSRLYYWEDKLRIGDLTTAPKNLGITNQNIYITSDEEIKDGDWHLNIVTNKISKYNIGLLNPNRSSYKKIILTTDQDLIKDGVQTIDDEFLEWFVKNPSCEEVEVVVENYEDNEWIGDDWGGEIYTFEYERYKIIIPKEEPKQEPNFYEKLKEYFENTPREKVLEDWNKSAHLDNVGPTVDEFLENSNEERLKDVAERFYSEQSESYENAIEPTFDDSRYLVTGFIDGVKSDIAKEYWFEKFEEDLKTAYFSGIKTTGEGWNGEYANGNNPSIEEEFQEGFQEWLRHFKKK
jgi:hypothetical protein